MSSDALSATSWEIPEAGAERPPKLAPKIQIRSIEKRFVTREGTHEVIGGISLSVAAGETVAIVGPSGCGKSTLVNILAGFDAPDAGAVLIDGKPLRGASRNGIVISQQGSVFPWLTVLDNVCFGLDAREPARRASLAHHYVELVGLKGFERRFPHELSGGMLKRVEIARALAVKPEILYMDEPFSALDALTSFKLRSELIQMLDEQRQTLVLITHDVEEAIHLAQRILVLSTTPAVVKASFEVDLPRPRKLTSPEAQSLKERVLRELGI